MTKLFEIFPYLENDKVIIKRMELNDVEALSEISNNDNVYKFIPPFLYKKSSKALETAIKHLSLIHIWWNERNHEKIKDKELERKN